MTSVMEDYATIKRLSGTLRERDAGICMMRAGGSVNQCWCHCSGINGATLPCPPITPPAEQPAPEPVGHHNLADLTPVPYRVLHRVLP